MIVTSGPPQLGFWPAIMAAAGQFIGASQQTGGGVTAFQAQLGADEAAGSRWMWLAIGGGVLVLGLLGVVAYKKTRQP